MVTLKLFRYPMGKPGRTLIKSVDVLHPGTNNVTLNQERAKLEADAATLGRVAKARGVKMLYVVHAEEIPNATPDELAPQEAGVTASGARLSSLADLI